MAERRRRTGASSKPAGGGARWWWLAIPALGLAAYAAFDATLGLVGGGPDATSPPAVLDASTTTRRSGFAPAADAPAPPPSGDPAVSAADPASDAVSPVASVAPEPTATPAAQRAAAAKPAVKRKPAPKENLTESDRRALEDVLERATKQNAR